VPELERIPFTCTLDCGSRCELVAVRRAGELLRLDTPERPDTVERPRLIPCARGRAQRRTLTLAERVTEPLERTGPRGSGQFRPLAWDEALDRVAEQLIETRANWGAAAILLATGAGAISGRGLSGSAAARRFFSYWDDVSLAEGNESNYNASMAANWMLGGFVPGSDRATLLDAKLILLWGMNPAETRMGPNTEHFIASAREGGAHVVLIDPRLSDSGVLADEWLPIRPGSDAALIAAIAFVLEQENLVDHAFLATHTVGYEAYRAYVLGQSDGQPKTPAWAAAITGAPAEQIHTLARRYGHTHPCAVLAGWGPQRSRFGEQAARALITLACLGGNVGVAGGGLASVGTRGNLIPLAALPAGPRGIRRLLAPGQWAQSVLDPALDPPLKLAYIVASNVINRSPDTQRNVQALAALDMVVVHEPFLTPTARHADLVLPVSIELERPDLVTSWGHDSHLFYAQQATEPRGAARTDYWVFCQLAHRLGFGELYTQGLDEEGWLERLLADCPLDVERLRAEGLVRLEGAPRVALDAFHADPHQHPLPTPSGRIEIETPPAARHGLPTLPTYLPDDSTGADPSYPLQLVTPHSKLRSNSCLHANPWLQRLEPHAVWLNPADAGARGIVADDPVIVSSPQGVIALPAKVTERIMPGVVCVYQGTWFAPDSQGIDHGGCANVLTAQVLSPSGGYATHTTWVQVAKKGA
jgi:anaerobic dimethyl sulfoxide reductase subunit A